MHTRSRYLISWMAMHSAVFSRHFMCYLCGMKRKLFAFAVMLFLFNCIDRLQAQTAADFNTMGVAKIQEEDYRAAIEYFTNAIAIEPDFAPAYCNRGISKLKLEDYAAAIKDLNLALKLNPMDAVAFCNRGISKSNRKDFLPALNDFNEAIILNPNYGDAYYNRGMTRIQSGDNVAGCQDIIKSGELGDERSYDAIREYCK